ncbi:MAG: hypothetical protein KDB60_10795 [Propionibacteriaceae bacterium]|nr:hypothetical protein [Propionibacteriaceae bacterium]
MGVRNYLVEGVSGSGKTTVCRELQRRGHHAVNGDTELAYRRLAARPEDEWGGRPAERALALRLQQTREDLPDGACIDATAPLADVVDEILLRCATGGGSLA